MPLELPAAILRRVLTRKSTQKSKTPRDGKRVDFKSDDTPVSPAPDASTRSCRSKTRSLSPPLVTPTPSMASNASGVLLGSCAIPRKKLVLLNDWQHTGAEEHKISDVYDVDEAIVGYGGFGTVRKGTLKGSPTVVRAIKTVWKRNLKAQSFVRDEIRVLRRLDHPCICRLLETFEDDRAIYLVLEFIDGKELFDEIVEGGCLAEEQACAIMRQVFSALRYCHGRNVQHRDMKPDNIMIQRHGASSTPSTPEVKLIDFGLAVISSRAIKARTGSSVVGSADYLAPEARKGTCLPASDMWSAGMVLHALLVGNLPAWGAKPEDGFLDFSAPEYNQISPSAKDLMLGLLQVDASKRLDAAAAASHPWSQGLEVKTPPTDFTPTLASFVSFHRSAKLRRAALTALALQLTSKQLSSMREQFLLLDANGDGKISREEFATSVALSSPGGATQDVQTFVESIFDSAYSDASQEIEYTEFLAAALQEGAYRSEEAMRAAFRIFDTDGDGNIDQLELGKVLSQTPEEISSFFPDFDANGDGVIDFEEFKKIFESGLVDLELPVAPGTTKLSL
eukprot:TRINITY_DN22452_c0_g1_i1.p1 TRINITY_DN22452_c0_g1~~TRINITY_DN22452_c0_g1_i1.p1  ORF type:complete len:565 (+),score=130.08 TRINITY_DN22452_c0_g1_i1:105-1799(+)